VTHPDYPIESILRTDDPSLRTRLVRDARRPANDSRDDSIALIASYGVHVLGRCEETLRRATDALAGRYAPDIAIEGPRVRYVRGARTLEPWMRVVVQATSRDLALLRIDLERRGAVVLCLEHGVGRVALEAEAPLARLLGYSVRVAACTLNVAVVAMRLSRYLLLEGDPDPATMAKARQQGSGVDEDAEARSPAGQASVSTGGGDPEDLDRHPDPDRRADHARRSLAPSHQAAANR
jgi:hypothetical protein